MPRLARQVRLALCLLGLHVPAVYVQLSDDFRNPWPKSLTSTCCLKCLENYLERTCSQFSTSYAAQGLEWFLPASSGDGTFNKINGQKASTYPSNSASRYTAKCRECPPGWYRRTDTCLCERCTATSCTAAQYQLPCTPTTDTGCASCDICGIGTQVRTSCTANSNTVCEDCPSGTYRNSQWQARCVNCATCDTQQRQRNNACGGTESNRCDQCGEGNIVTGPSLDTCSQCTGGTYADNANNQCQTCQTCARTHYQSGTCTSASNRACQACPNNRITSETNSASCSACKTGYYNAGGSTGEPMCNECATSSCGTIGTYVSCTTTDQMGSRTCEWCEGQAHEDSVKCAAGSGVSRACDGTGTTKTSCALCEAGTERPAGTAMVDMGSSRLIQKCITCGTGKFKAGTSSANCGNCTNKPANSQYTSWSAGTTPSSNTCPWQCNAGYLRSGSACTACPTGRYSTAAGLSSCQQCTNAPNGTYYLQRSTTPPDSSECPWDCNAGSVRTGATCVACTAGKYREASQNRLSESAVANACFTCSECTAQVMGSSSDGRTPVFTVIGSFMTSDCVASRDRQCQTCSTSCLAGRRISAACTKTQDLQCTACVTRCDPGQYMGAGTCTGNTLTDRVRESCTSCVASCGENFYLNGLCPGNTTQSNRCVSCNLDLVCVGQYRAGCSGLLDTYCNDFPVCGDNEYLSDESFTQAGSCRPCSTCGELAVLRPCTRFDDVVCRSSKSCAAGLPCSTQTATNRSSLFCDYSQGEARATCGVCPPGYSSDGQYCVECPRGYTCDRVGRAVCRGQCPAWTRSECVSEFGLGYARCPAEAACDRSINFGETRVPWRGSFELADESNCVTFFLCSPGHYKNFSSGGSVSCDACNQTLLPVGAEWVTEGLSLEDDASCLWDCRERTHALSASGLGCAAKPGQRGTTLRANEAGYWRGELSGEVCGMGLTSQAGAAIAPEECLQCQPLVPDVMRWRDKTDQCEFECLIPTDTRRGSQCVPERRDCAEPGLVLDGTACTAQAYPWNRPGKQRTGGVVVARRAVVSTGGVQAPYPRMETVGFGIKGRHSVIPAPGASPVRVEGQLCSSTTGTVNGHAYVFGAVCNTSFLVYLNLSNPGMGLRVLIGSGQRGWRDGFKTQALFESELYVAGTGNGTLFVLDTWNCLLREVVVWDRPGSYLTRAHTLWGNTDKLTLDPPESKCYGPGSLAWPRRIWPLRGEWLAFADEDGLWQVHTGTREVLETVKEEDVPGGFEADALLALALPDEFTLELTFEDGALLALEAAQEPCPDGLTSLAGGACTVECRWRDQAGAPVQYVDQATGLCRPCARPACGRGEELVVCSARTDGYCRRCALWADPACGSGCLSGSSEVCTSCSRLLGNGSCACLSRAGAVYSQAGTCDETVLRPLPPCTPGWYLAGESCVACPAYTATVFSGATRLEQCKCVEGMSRRGGECVGEDLYEFESSCLGSEACSVPRNAAVRANGGAACAWLCNAGYYRDTRAGFLDQCRPCLVGQARTAGDDDEPWSCE